ncbi:MAG: diguanylate cyclase response regulator [Betaproteobacteria bacterium HGW-Betaproteobacteria-12]|nr:MAG: diguanylate cyclase response regulator [Betaproteobacteria bacterium HGW-Betaproteobacteria-12]
MSHSFHSVIALAEILERRWQNYRSHGEFDLFVEFTVSLNGLTERLRRRQMPGLVRACQELENAALALFGDPSLHPVPIDQANGIERRFAQLLAELRRQERPSAPARRLSDAAGPLADEAPARPRHIRIVAPAQHAWVASLQAQLAFFGFTIEISGWEARPPAVTPPLAILFVPERPGGAYPPAAVSHIMALRTCFPTSNFYCLAVPENLQSIVLLQRAGADACIPADSGISDILSRLLDLVRQDEPEADRVLIVEDSATATAHVRRSLAQHGIDSLAIDDPRKLLEAAAEYRPDAILMDMYMPFCSGVEATAALRQVATYQALPIIYLSSESDIVQQVEALRLGGDQFLTKPVNPVVLAAVVKTKIARYREMRHSGQHDSLTRLLNHSTAKMRIGQLVADSGPGGRLVVAMIDIDRFKRINDTYGHPAGDKVIRSLAWLLRGRLRNTDLIGRYGGEEFIVALPDTDIAGALEQFERIREDFAVLPHPHPEGPLYATFSCGLADLADFPSATDLIGAADAALLAAKRQGRNRVLAAAPDWTLSLVAGMQMEETTGS